MSSCANYSHCDKAACFTCKQCRLVAYCSAECQKEDWSHHKEQCSSDLGSISWKPAWTLEGRMPNATITNAPGANKRDKSIWGNRPATDVLNLKANEKVPYDEDVRILFAASGDLRNVVETIASLPEDFTGKFHATVNDMEFHATARSIIVLLLLFTIDDAKEAAEAVTHIWYSAFLKLRHFGLLQKAVRPLVRSVHSKTAKKKPSMLQAKTWKFGTSSLRVTLLPKQWETLLKYLYVPYGLTFPHAVKLMRDVTLAEGARDTWELDYAAASPSYRLACHQFRHDGLLLPFGADRTAFKVPNPTLFQSLTEYPLNFVDDPMAGWDMRRVSEHPFGPATSDLYGKMGSMVEEKLRLMHKKLRETSVGFHVLNLAPAYLPNHVERGSCSRIDTANLCEYRFHSYEQCLTHLGPLLQPPSKNPHATMLMLFANAVNSEVNKMELALEGLATSGQRLKFLGGPGHVASSISDPYFMLFTTSIGLFIDKDKYFERFMMKVAFDYIVCRKGLQRKKDNTVVDKYPTALKIPHDQEGAKEEFDLVMQSSHNGQECYVELKWN